MPHRWHKRRSMSTELWCGTGPMPWTGRCTMRRFWRFPTQRSRVSCSNQAFPFAWDPTPLAVCPVREHPQQRIEESVGPARSVAWHGPRAVHASRTGIEPTRPADSGRCVGVAGLGGTPCGTLVGCGGRSEGCSGMDCTGRRHIILHAAPTTATNWPLERYVASMEAFSIPDAGSCGPGRQPRGSP